MLQRDLPVWQKRPACVAKETCLCGKRDLPVCTFRARGAPVSRLQPLPAHCALLRHYHTAQNIACSKCVVKYTLSTVPKEHEYEYCV